MIDAAQALDDFALPEVDRECFAVPQVRERLFASLLQRLS